MRSFPGLSTRRRDHKGRPQRETIKETIKETTGHGATGHGPGPRATGHGATGPLIILSLLMCLALSHLELELKWLRRPFGLCAASRRQGGQVPLLGAPVLRVPGKPRMGAPTGREPIGANGETTRGEHKKRPQGETIDYGFRIRGETPRREHELPKARPQGERARATDSRHKTKSQHNTNTRQRGTIQRTTKQEKTG